MSCPDISEVTYFPCRNTEKGLIGFSSLLYDNKISLQSISVYLTPTGEVRLLFPDRILKNGKTVSVYYPINRETYELMRAAVAKKVEEVAEKAKGQFYACFDRIS